MTERDAVVQTTPGTESSPESVPMSTVGDVSDSVGTGSVPVGTESVPVRTGVVSGETILSRESGNLVRGSTAVPVRSDAKGEVSGTGVGFGKGGVGGVGVGGVGVGGVGVSSGFWVVGDFLADAILLLVLVGVVAEWLWILGWDSDAVGFAWIGGGMGYLMAYFAFALFGVASLWRSSDRFWRGLHPFNLGLAGVAAASAWTAHFPAQFAAVAVGVFAALRWGDWLLSRARWLTLGCFAAIFAARWTLPWHWVAPLGAGAGAFLILLSVRNWREAMTN